MRGAGEHFKQMAGQGLVLAVLRKRKTPCSPSREKFILQIPVGDTRLNVVSAGVLSK